MRLKPTCATALRDVSANAGLWLHRTSTIAREHNSPDAIALCNVLTHFSDDLGISTNEITHAALNVPAVDGANQKAYQRPPQAPTESALARRRLRNHNNR